MTIANGTKFWKYASTGTPYSQNNASLADSTTDTWSVSPAVLYSWIVANTGTVALTITLTSKDGTTNFPLNGGASIGFGNGELSITSISIANSSGSTGGYLLVGNLGG